MMLKRSPIEKRRSERRLINRIANVRAYLGASLGSCLITDISEGGVRLHVETFELPDKFELLISGDGMPADARTCLVVWRLGNEVGAEFVGGDRGSSGVS